MSRPIPDYSICRYYFQLFSCKYNSKKFYNDR
jgi:hypothetical protein